MGLLDLRDLKFDEAGGLLVSQSLPPYVGLTAAGTSWQVATATAFAPVAAVPTTTAALEVYNNTTGRGSMVMVIDSLFAFQLLSTAVDQTYAIWAMVSTQKAAPSNTALNIYSNSGLPVRATTAVSRVITGVGTTVVANGWRPWGVNQAWGLAAATPGNSLVAEVRGRLLVPPGCSLCLHVAGSVATASSFNTLGPSWYELPLNVTV